MSRVKCALKCMSNSHEPIILSHLKPTILGRSPDTKIKDKRCSKAQVELSANCDLFKVQYKHLGSNCGGFKGHPVKTGETYQLRHGDTFEFLLDQYPHKVEFSPPPSALEHHSEDTGTQSNGFTMPRNPKRKCTEGEKSEEKKICHKNEPNQWESYTSDLLIYNRNAPSSEKVACYDIDGTLITTASGRVFPKDVNDWKILFPQVPGKLKELSQQGFKIVIFTNQAGVATGKISVKDIETKIERILDKFGISAQVLVSTGKGKYRKPTTGMWDLFIKECNANVQPDLESSFYVGDAAGRPEIPKQRKKDHSISDRLFALNIGLPFYTPEEHFLGHKAEKFTMPEFIPSSIDAEAPLYIPSSIKVPRNNLEVIILVGFPGSGKSTFVEKHLLKLGYIQTNRDKIGSWQKCVSVMEKSLQDKKHVVIDNTNPDKSSRERYLEAAKKLSVPVRCFIMNVTLNQAKHNNKFREITGSEHAKVNDMIYNMYKSKYEEPSLDEGFQDIIRVNFIPHFKNSKMEKLYKSFLLEK